MKYLIFAVTIFLTLGVFVERIHGVFGLNFFEEPIPGVVLNNELQKSLESSNKWGYSVSEVPPYVSLEGLTYELHTTYEFSNRKFTDPEKAISLFLEIYQDHLHKINSLRVLRPFLNEFPVNPDKCTLGLNFLDKNREFYDPPVVSHLYAGDGNLTCSQYEKDRPICKWHVNLVTRSFEEIDEIRALRQYGVPRGSPSQIPHIPILKRTDLHYRDIARRLLFEWIVLFSKRHNICPLAMGPVGDREIDRKLFNFLLMGYRQLDLNSARRLAGACFRECFSLVKNSDECHIFIKKVSKYPHTDHPSPIPVPEEIAFRISFWDKNLDRVEEPVIAEIRCFNGIFRYYTADDGQKLVLVCQETLEEAMKFLDQHPMVTRDTPAL